ncbi:MAG: nucleotidyltransferase family protein [Burkholderiales bacterium]|nr:nucleotidyltransferase family protein [Burkholderiales bacterium]
MNPREPDWALIGLREPQRLLALSPAQWSIALRQARSAGVLARIGVLLGRLEGARDTLPPQVRGYLQAEQRRTDAQHEEVRLEIAALRDVLAPLGLPVILLKGAAYLALHLPANAGRAFSDVDLLVPKARLADAEAALMQHGWMTTHHSAYDQRYYREWMHELPPLRHVVRQSVLDVHHTLLPETARSHPDPALLFAAAQPVPGWPGVMTLSPMDMVLHSMTHLFHNDDLSRGLRDLSDLDLLLRHFAADAQWWRDLVARARALDLARPLYYGLSTTSTLLGTPVPEATLQACDAMAPGPMAQALMRRVWARALGSQHPSTADGWTPAALFLLYLRGHWLRMPPGLLVRHLAVKAWMGLWPEPTPP